MIKDIKQLWVDTMKKPSTYVVSGPTGGSVGTATDECC